MHLMLHSDNVLSDRGDYVRIACELFAELENLKNSVGWEQKASLGKDVENHTTQIVSAHHHDGQAPLRAWHTSVC